MSSIDPNFATAGDLFNESDLAGGGNTVVVPQGDYNLLLSARYNKTGGGIVFIEGRVQDGPEAGKAVKVFTAKFHASEGQRGVSRRNLDAIGIGTEALNLLSRQVGATANDLTPLYENLAKMIDGRVIAATLIENTFDGKNGSQTEMQMAVGKASLISAPQVAIAGVPQAAPAAPQAAPAATPAAQPTPQAVPAPQPVAPVQPQAEVPPTAPATAPVTAPVAAPVAPAAPVAEQPVAAPVAAPAAPVAEQPVQPVAAPQPPAAEGAQPAPGVTVAPEPSF